MRYRPEIDGLRAIAVIPVVLYHAGIGLFSGGFAGVDVFFVISGYLITTIIWEEMQSGSFTIAQFYERRARRILPALLVVLATTIPFAWLFLLPNEMEGFAKSIVAAVFFCSNILFWKDAGDYFGTPTELKPLIHTWSLAVEEQYYVIFPLLLLVVRPLKRYWVHIILGTIFVASISLAQWYVSINPAASFYLLPTRFWELLIGSFAAALLRNNSTVTLNRPLAEFLSGVGLSLIAVSVLLYTSKTPFPSVYTIAPTLGAALLIIFAQQGTFIYRLLANRIFVDIGLISYSLYLWHQPLFAFAKHQTQLHLSAWIIVTLCLISVLLAYVSRQFVELPFRNRSRIKKSNLIIYATTISAALVVFGVLGTIRQGDLGRYTSDELAVLGDHRQHNAYVWARKNLLELKPFVSEAKTKILVIGDSFSADIINTIYESGVSKSTSISSIGMSSRCLHFFSEQLTSRAHQKTDSTTGCSASTWYKDRNTFPLLEQADIILIAGDWSDQDVDFMPKDYVNMTNLLGNKVYIVGTKGIDTDIGALANVPVKYRRSYIKPPSKKAKEINKKLELLFGEKYFDVLKLMCPEDKCSVFTQDLKLISFDSTHLTEAGARYLGVLLYGQQPFSNILNNH